MQVNGGQWGSIIANGGQQRSSGGQEGSRGVKRGLWGLIDINWSHAHQGSTNVNEDQLGQGGFSKPERTQALT